MLLEIGTCPGIENYSRHLSGAKAGDPPPTLVDYLPQDALMFLDESHVLVGQRRAAVDPLRERAAAGVEERLRVLIA